MSYFYTLLEYTGITSLIRVQIKRVTELQQPSKNHNSTGSRAHLVTAQILAQASDALIACSVHMWRNKMRVYQLFVVIRPVLNVTIIDKKDIGVSSNWLPKQSWCRSTECVMSSFKQPTCLNTYPHSVQTKYCLQIINPLKTKLNLFYIKTHYVPRSKQFPKT